MSSTLGHAAPAPRAAQPRPGARSDRGEVVSPVPPHEPHTPAGRAAGLPAWLDRDLYPFAPRAFDGPHGRSSYLDEGPRDAATLLLVHGLPTWSFLWRELIPPLARHHRVVAPDHLGFGLSEAPDPDRFGYRLADHTVQLTALVEHLGLERITLLAHDFGGPIALPLALAGERVERLVLTNTFLWPEERPAVRAAGAFIASRAGRALYRRFNLAARAEMPLVSARRFDPEARRHYLAAQGDVRRRHGAWMMARELNEASARMASLWERRERLARLPTLLLWGLRDPLVGRAALERWQTALPDATTVAYPGTGHFTAEELGATLADPILTATGHPPKAARGAWPEEELERRGIRRDG